MKKASFLFVGKAAEAEMMDAVRSLTADCPDNVFYVKRLTRDEIKSLMAQCTCLVCASRDDPMPTFVTEGLIFGKPAIVSEHTGTAGLITEGVDGFVYEDDDPEKLAERRPGPSSTRKSWLPCAPPAVSFTKVITPSRRFPTVYNKL